MSIKVKESQKQTRGDNVRVSDIIEEFIMGKIWSKRRFLLFADFFIYVLL